MMNVRGSAKVIFTKMNLDKLTNTSLMGSSDEYAAESVFRASLTSGY